MKEKYIINSFLWTDFYKFSMGQFVFHRYPNVEVEYAFTNRTTTVPLGHLLKEEDLRRELDHVLYEVRPNNSDLHYLRGTNEYGDRMFKEDYLDFLKNIQLPHYHLEKKDDQYAFTVRGPWSAAIYWEIPALVIFSTLYNRALTAQLSPSQHDAVYATGMLRLAEKIKILKENPDVIFSDFSTRRPFSPQWQEYVIRRLVQELPKIQFLGTSNVYLANKYNTMPMGTSAHELQMVLTGILRGKCENEFEAAQKQLLDEWWNEYGYGLSIFLPDTYGTDFFLKNLTDEQLKKWKGFRIDSRDPFIAGEQIIALYESHGIDPKEKLIIPSDGLELPAMIKLKDTFKEYIKESAGWGGGLGNDCGFKPISIIIKPISANGNFVVKLPDNIAKAIGPLPEIERAKKLTGYKEEYNVECKY